MCYAPLSVTSNFRRSRSANRFASHPYHLALQISTGYSRLHHHRRVKQPTVISSRSVCNHSAPAGLVHTRRRRGNNDDLGRTNGRDDALRSHLLQLGPRRCADNLGRVLLSVRRRLARLDGQPPHGGQRRWPQPISTILELHGPAPESEQLRVAAGWSCRKSTGADGHGHDGADLCAAALRPGTVRADTASARGAEQTEQPEHVSG